VGGRSNGNPKVTLELLEWGEKFALKCDRKALKAEGKGRVWRGRRTENYTINQKGNTEDLGSKESNNDGCLRKDIETESSGGGIVQLK